MKAKSSPLSSNNHHDIGGQCHESIIINESPESGEHHARKRYRRLSPGSRVAEWSKCRSAGSEMPGTQAWSRLGVMIIGNVARCIMVIFIQCPQSQKLNSTHAKNVSYDSHTQVMQLHILICKGWDSLKIISFKSWMRCISWSVLYQVPISGSICGRLMNAGGRVVGWRDPSHWTASHRGQHQPLLHHRSNPFPAQEFIHSIYSSNSYLAAIKQWVMFIRVQGG